jgi:hypothetical protein
VNLVNRFVSSIPISGCMLLERCYLHNILDTIHEKENAAHRKDALFGDFDDFTIRACFVLY